jgi:dCTP deaminase
LILSAQTIRKLVVITPFNEEQVGPLGLSYGLGPAGYDVRLQDKLVLEAHGWELGSIIEHIELPANVVASVHDKSSWARLGVTVQNTTVEPGWHGWLTLELSNHSAKQVVLPAGVPIAKLRFQFLDEATERTYNGRYQDQGRGPRPAKLTDG